MAGNTKSRLVTGLSKENVTPLSKKLDKKVVEGIMIHCKPHVPSTPPEPTSNPTDKATIIVSIDKPSPIVTGTPKQVIPGMPETDRLKHLKKQKKKENRRKRQEVKEKKSTQLDQNDFLLCPKSGNKMSGTELAAEEFTYSDDNTDYDSDAFEDSKEVLSDADESLEDFLTPINFKSSFGLRISSSTPDLTVNSKRPAQSPIEKAERKKTRSTANKL